MLRKAYIGFAAAFSDASVGVRSVATGNWGCGAFFNNKDVIFAVQALAAAAAELPEPLHYYAHDRDLSKGVALVESWIRKQVACTIYSRQKAACLYGAPKRGSPG